MVTTNKICQKRVVLLFAMIACVLLATETFALSQSDYKASIIGLAVVESHMIFYDEAARANVDFSPPQTHLVFPYGKALLIQIAYECPEEDQYGMALWASDEKWSADHGGWGGYNPSGRNVGTGIGYGFITLDENRWDSTLEVVRIKTIAGNYGNSWVVCRATVDVLFIGGHFIRVDFDPNGVWSGEWMASQHFFADEPQKLSKNTFAEDGMIFLGWATTIDRALQGIVDYLDEEIITVDADITLYAVWTRAPTIYFVPNTATESNWEDWKSQFFNAGEPQKLLKNTYTRDGWVFQGWATTWERASQGYVDYVDEEEVTINSDQWLYAVWTAAPLTLEAESADWSSGSITLRCEDGDASAATHKYSLEYCNESGEWVEVERAKNISATKSQNSDGQEVWIAKLTDTAFSSRLGGIPPVSYRVKDENNRMSEPCVTRNRHGIFVGVGEYGSDYPYVKELENAPKQAAKIQNLARGNAGFTDFHLLQNSAARYADVNSAFNAVAENVKDKPGDICIVYFSTHGGVYKDTTVGSLVLYDKPPVAVDPHRRGYHEGLLASHIRSLDPQRKGVGVVCIVSACHSGAFIDDSNEEMCSELTSWCHKEDLGDNVAWITAANASSSSVGLFDNFMIEYGWEQGWARKNSTQSGTAISFYDLGRYAIAMYNPVAQKLGLSGGEKRKDDVLRNIVAGTIDNEPNLLLAAPSSPFDVQATKDKSDYVTVRWKQGSGGQPDGYLVLRNRKDSDEYAGFESAGRNETSKDLPDTASQEHPMKYAVAAYNGAGVAVSDGFAEGWRAIQLYQATFFYDLPGGYHLESGVNTWVSPFMEDGQSLTPYMEEVTAIADAWELAGWSFVGWKNRTGTFVASKSTGIWRYSPVIVHGDLEYHAAWTAMTQDWLDSHPTTAAAANGDIATAATMAAANGCRTVGECYALGINPEDPDDDLRIVQFELKDGKPQILLNHMEDGSGNSFLPNVRLLGTSTLGATGNWDDITDITDPDAAGYRFYKAGVYIP